MPNLTVLQAAESTDLTKLEHVKLELGISSTGKNAWISSVIPAASRLIEQEANNFWAAQQYEELISGSGSARLMLARTPIIGTPTIVIDSVAVADFIVEDAEAGVLYRRQGWTRRVSYWPMASRDPIPYEDHPHIYVTYWAGYNLPSFTSDVTDADDLPASIERAAILSIKDWYNKRSRDPNVSWKQVGDLALGFRKSSEGDTDLRLPPEARALISKRVV